MEEKTQEKKCPFFDVCAAYIIREHRKENWITRFCFADFPKCVHYKDRIEINAFLTREGKKVKLYPK